MRLLTRLLAVFVSASCPAQDLLYTQGFEDDRASLAAEGWKLPATVSLDTSNPQEGKQCLKLQTPDAKHRYAELFIPVEAGKFYRAEAWVRCENVVRHPDAGSNRGAVLFCQWATHEKKWRGGGSFPRGLQGDHDWTRLEVPYTREIPKDVGYIQLMVGIEGSGAAWFDGLVVEEIAHWDGVRPKQPEDRQTVDTRRPLLAWSVDDKRVGGGEITMARSEDLSQGAISFQAETNDTYPPDALAPGRWYWRVQPSAAGRLLPPGRVASFTIPPGAPIWPPDIEPMWEWSDDPRPVLKARIHPADVAGEVAAAIGGVAAEIVSREGEVVSFQPKDKLAVGVHEVTVTVSGPGGRSASLKGIFCNKQPGARVTIRDDKVLLVDGEPFFPLGAYRDPSDRLDEFTGLEQAGFNVTHSYGFEDQSTRTVQQAREYLQACHARGLKVFMGFRRDRVRERDHLWLQRWAAELMDEPGLLTWYLLDEPAAHGLPASAMTTFHRRVKTVDPFHPTSVVMCRPDAFEAYAPTCDIFWNDPYPIPSRPVTMVDDWARRALAVVGAEQPYWIVLQGHDIRYWRDYKAALEQFGPVRRPTPEETRCMAHIALANGAKGIIWYWGPSNTYHMVRDAPQVWQGLVDTVQELSGLAAFLTARPTGRDEVAVAEPLRAWSRQAAGRRVLALVNTADEGVEASVDLGAFGVTEVTRRETGEAVALEEGTLVVSFAPHEVKLYEWAEEG